VALPGSVKEEAVGRAARDRRALGASAEEGVTTRGTTGRFRKIIYRYYRDEGRSLPWRETDDPYRILASEFMLQQTQVERVKGKYEAFLAAFPDWQTLAEAALPDVLTLWQGLGYNRRALSLHRAANHVVGEWKGRLPGDPDLLQTLPGVGAATAGAVAAFAFNRPAVFLETNIRRVFIHFFFPSRIGITDGEILPLVDQTLDRGRPRRWYYALMDYGAMLQKIVANPNRRSAHYQRQAPFEGSDRQVRSRALRILLAGPGMTEGELLGKLSVERGRAKKVVDALRREGFLEDRRGIIRVAGKAAR